MILTKVGNKDYSEAVQNGKDILWNDMKQKGYHCRIFFGAKIPAWD